MKKLLCLMTALYVCCIVQAQAPLLILCKEKTVSLIFPTGIKHVDRGSKEVLVQVVKESGNILLVKAATEVISESNLTVFTDGGGVYSFIVCSGQPDQWVHYLPQQGKAPLSHYTKGLMNNGRNVKGIKRESGGMSAEVQGLYIKDSFLLVHLRLGNGSSMHYEIAFFRFAIRSRKEFKRKAAQELELTPHHLEGNRKAIKAGTVTHLVVVLPKYAFTRAKFLAIQIGEREGERNLLLKVSSRHLLKASILSDSH